MKSHVNLKTTCSRIALLTILYWTNEGFMARVSHFMCLKMTFSDESIMAFLTFEGSDSSVDSHVSLEVACLCKLFHTCLVRADEYTCLIAASLDFLDYLKRL